MIASAINDRPRRKLDYVEEEGRILREQLDAATGGKMNPSAKRSLRLVPDPARRRR
jgi:hypothetical protein